MSKHKCVDCGFIAARNFQTRSLDEVEKAFRDSGEPKLIRSLQAQAHNWGADIPKDEPYPICFKSKYDLIAEVQAMGGHIPSDVRSIIQLERDCDSFVEWRQGFTPKEHQDMQDREDMLKREYTNDEADKRWREGREDIAQEFQKKEGERNRRSQLLAGIIGAIIGILGTLAGVIITHLLNNLAP